jgi:hypothetical protein
MMKALRPSSMLFFSSLRQQWRGAVESQFSDVIVKQSCFPETAR